MKKYRIRVENSETGKMKMIVMNCFYIGSVIKKLGSVGWIVTKHYEI